MPEANFDDVIFSATLTPHRSLGGRGMILVLAAVGGFSLSIGSYVWWIGAWPVVGFIGLDVAAIALAFHLNARAARTFEEVAVTRTEIVVRKVAASGRAYEFRFNPLWVKLEVQSDEDEGVARITLRARDRHLRVGAFLNPEDRTSFARALGAAIATVRA
jgi:uncharacterized membrane protein